MLTRILIITAIVVVLDIYFFQAVRTLLVHVSPERRSAAYWIYWFISAGSLLFAACFLVMPEAGAWKVFKLYGMSMVVSIFICKILGVLPLIIDDLIRLATYMGGIFSAGGNIAAAGSGITRAKFLSQMAVVVAAIPMGTFIYGMARGAFNYRVRNVKLKIHGLQDGLDGLKIVQLSDLHLGSFVSQSPLKSAVEIINKQKADLVFFTGDLVNNRAGEAEDFIGVLREITAPMGVYSILGNHDYGNYVTWESDEAKLANLMRLVDIHAEMGWKLLCNEHVILNRKGAKLAVIGVENWSDRMRFPKYGDLEKAGRGTGFVGNKFLLTHDPSHWKAEVTKSFRDIDCTFSGHTHGMQFGIEIPGFRWSPVQYVYKHWAGLYRENGQQLYVNRGLGFIGYMGRVGISPEITVFKLEAV